MGKGEARVTATAAVHSEVFVLTRDVFVAIKSDKGDGDGRQGGTARRLEALQSVPCLAQLPAGTLSRLEAAATEVTLAPDANPCAEATDNWLLLITGGRLELSHLTLTLALSLALTLTLTLTLPLTLTLTLTRSPRAEPRPRGRWRRRGAPSQGDALPLTLTLTLTLTLSLTLPLTLTLTKAKRGALMARFELEAGSAGEEL